MEKCCPLHTFHVPRSPNIRLSFDSLRAIATGSGKNNHFGIFACSSRARSPTDWLTDRQADEWTESFYDSFPPLPPPHPSVSCSVSDSLASYWNCRQTILKLKLRFWSCCRVRLPLSVPLTVSLCLSVPFDCLRQRPEYHLGCCTNRVTVKCPFQAFSNFVAFR